MNLYHRLKRLTDGNAETQAQNPVYLNSDEDEKDREFLKVVVRLYETNRSQLRCLQRYFNGNANFLTTSQRIATEMDADYNKNRPIKEAIRSL